eukprot:gnl/TRDRNA2_/TRDRNA2_54472_c0_seq1.p1 gnl/TRDRNA2_/TRDRNA2_54472_c0~~gnl/TRDRNA2_/TRDRNA2_54472_c0_seq1.p1  ORF type:complete len:251 (-),score=27.00 gnl/TRDRNA2_/TRDRNA2_54472_c0_seq1:84-758(-)
MPDDRPYDSFSPQDFEEHLLRANHRLQAVMSQGSQVKWFRAPQGRYTRSMDDTVRRHGMRHVLADGYCNDFNIQDSDWIADTTLRQVSSGSIILLHMPERGHWEHTFEALRKVLEGISLRGLCAVTVSMLADLAEGKVPASSVVGSKVQAAGYCVASHHDFGNVDGVFVDTLDGALTYFAKLTRVKAHMVIDPSGSEVRYYGLRRGRDSEMMQWWRDRMSHTSS